MDYDYCGASVYNILIEDGSLISGERYLALNNMDKNSFLESVKTTYATIWADQAQGAMRDMYNSNIENVSFETVTPFLDDENHLCFVGLVWPFGGQGQVCWCFDSTAKDYKRVQYPW